MEAKFPPEPPYGKVTRPSFPVLVLFALGAASQAAGQVPYTLSPPTGSSFTAPGGTCKAYSQTFTASPAPPVGASYTPWSYSVRPSPPPGMTIDSATGVLSGWPSAYGTSSFQVTATSCMAIGCQYGQVSAQGNYTLTVGYSVTLSPAFLPQGQRCAPFLQRLGATGGSGSYAYTVVGGNFPSSFLNLATDGTLSGTPTATGTWTFTVLARDTALYIVGCQPYGQKDFTLTVTDSALTLVPGSLPDGSLCSSYPPVSVSATGGSGSYRYALTSGGVPPGMNFDPPSGLISGTPTAGGLYPFTIQATEVTGYPLPGCLKTGQASYQIFVPGTAPSISVQKTGTGSGTVTSSPSGLSCGSTCTANFACNTPVTLTAAADPGSVFAGWSGGGCGGTGTCSVSATSATAVTATFNRVGTTATLTGTTSICFGGTASLAVALTGTPPWSLTWSDGVTSTGIASSPFTRQVSPTTSTTYTITSVSDKNGSGTASGGATVTVSAGPGAPSSPSILPPGASSTPSHVNGIDPVTFAWSAPGSGAAPTRYQYNLNQQAWTAVSPPTATSVAVGPLRKTDPVTLYVQAFGCTPEQGGPVGQSATVSFAPPTANFSFPASNSVGTAVPFTDTSSPQATDWFWIFGDDGSIARSQAATHTFRASGTYKVALIATNGSGSTSKVQDVVVNPATRATSGGGAARAFVAGADGVPVLDPVEIGPGAPSPWLLVSSSSTERLTAFVRARAPDGTVAVERRLVVEPGQDAEFDLGALLPDGTYRLEFAAPPGMTPTLLERRPHRPAGGRSRP